ncbi:NAD-dependent epimerase/dehydratase family protein [Pseudonocardia kujensis]|uniref:NAD-dependent epimerase/dehydratase family protein n=1 Tax=Pseudonocardia kujensis TaxID=1128675 RepID=UPI001E583D84|nr:NAD-dependent epimerase/dehydratase family protein [Pseudonocardia kujensis]MCE0766324.1 NAD-dependent epimerase/dehydratase family protein [Pseudonocardia kujensis]
MTGPARTVVVVGASGTVGSGLLDALAARPEVTVRAVCRHPPADTAESGRLAWHPLDLLADDAADRLAAILRGADAVVHLAWAIQPVGDASTPRSIDLEGTATVLDAAGRAGVGHVVFLSSQAVYGPHPPGEPDRPVDESWPVRAHRGSRYSRDKVAAETMLDDFARDHPAVAVTRVRAALVVRSDAAGRMRRLFLGPAVPTVLLRALRAGRLPVLPLPAGLVLQLVHADDLGRAVAAVLDRRTAGAVNVAADALGSRQLAAVAGARPLPVPRLLVRAALGLLNRLHVLGATTGWFDLAVDTPVMDTGRARRELGWSPAVDTAHAARILLDALADTDPDGRSRPVSAPAAPGRG